MKYFLHQEYKIQESNTQYVDLPGTLIYQPLVYELAKYLADRSGAMWIIDIGCGSGQKLKSLSSSYDIIGIDCVVETNSFKTNLPKSRLIQCNFESEFPELDEYIIQNSIVICSDVIEHLRDPSFLARKLANLSNVAKFVLISTPDRCRARGWLDDGPPGNPAHVMEWSGSEFVHFLRQSGFQNLDLFGHTINTQIHNVKSTLLVVSGVLAQAPVLDRDRVKVAAIIHVFNERDVLPEVIDYLKQQQIEIHIFDNWSDDGSWEYLREQQLKGNLKNLERFPFDSQSENYEWHEQLVKTATYARTLSCDWVMHYDADEIREGPWTARSLVEAITRVDSLGFNAIDFTVIDFRFLEESINCFDTVQLNNNHFEFGRRPGHFKQIKCWKNSYSVNLADSGGHEAIFEGRKVFPLKFLMKHYSLRSKEQAEKKVFRDRLPRFEREQKIYGWHTQYAHLKNHQEIAGWKSHNLISWHPVYFKNEFLVERISGVGLDRSTKELLSSD